MTFDRNPSPAAETPTAPAATNGNGRYSVVHVAPVRAERRHGVVPADLRDRAVDEVLDRKARNGFLTNDDFHEIGQTVGRSGRTVRRWFDERIEGPGVLARERTRRGYRPDELAVTTLFACGGSVTAAYKSLRGAGMVDVSLSTFRRGLKRLAGQVLNAARFGAQGVRHSALYRLWSAAKPNDVAQLDTHICDTFVRPTAATTEPSEAFRPRITVVIDDCTRLITGVLVTRGDPKAEQIAHTLALAFRVRDRDGTGYGGRADRVLVDNAMAHLSRQVIEGTAAIGVQLEVVAPYSPESKAKVERWFATFEAMVGRRLPGYVGGHAKNQKGLS